MLQLVTCIKTRMLIGCGTTNITELKKAHVQPVAGALVSTHMHEITNKNKLFFRGRVS